LRINAQLTLQRIISERDHVIWIGEQIESRLLALDARKRIPPKPNAADPPSPGFGAADTTAATD
jgi:hypothetical protein